ncbi:hypothetical protein EN866_19570 [Mesorhizobium sp. M2D.F.Ca.ET.223.01.1.1]|uniref:hypothetical protein n=1 Tax=unclassified Mesorhizobium TaxID=325217 RepID=UPI000FC9D5F7|nr:MULTISPECIES: hypothetical protein [unclassified Mesorhizobium]TGP89361.1 hypothetical protein EN864_19580 [bacterium M00.F.Ca.ET.221.01.1.1]TGP94734.1 hypothetical protein EN865_15450 [bacterium M00.F.Ca.ET.222.01.1.1]RVD58852.1 hypothetical protein EN783_14545 [Mesorhizobium sp. M2D.F.Ca.ET.140.01.1.1]TGP27880.1 hypothetical protein EN875_033025 [Mesorhizobium sp. M2D.F.Ca.ET.232.01.1.1]TGP75902.1 hypothetical protein EN867_15450 [Mesorhizobium sp. M2D.F.Ca.ET.224.01.1.1]
MARNEPSALQIVLDELRALRADMRIELSALRADDVAIEKKASEAHSRLDALANQWKGVAWFSSIVTGVITVLGTAVTVWAKTR